MPNKATLALHSLSICSFTSSKLRYFELRVPKISSCYTNYYKNRLSMTAYFYILIITHLLTIGVSGLVNACSVSPTQLVEIREAGMPKPTR